MISVVPNLLYRTGFVYGISSLFNLLRIQHGFIGKYGESGEIGVVENRDKNIDQRLGGPGNPLKVRRVLFELNPHVNVYCKKLSIARGAQQNYRIYLQF